MATVLGLDCKAYRLTTGTRASWDGSTDIVVSGAAPSDLTEMTNTVEVTLPAGGSEADGSSRGIRFRKVLAALIDVEVTLRMIWDQDDAHQAAMIAARFAGTDVALLFLDGDKDTVGSEGFWIDGQITNFERGEPLEGVATMNFTIKPSAKSSVTPQWVTVST